MLLKSLNNVSRRLPERCFFTLAGILALVVSPLSAKEASHAVADSEDSYISELAPSDLDMSDAIASLDAAFPTQFEEEDALDMAKISEAFGHLIVSNLDNPGFRFDVESIIRGMRDALAGHPSPLTEDQYERAISSIQEKVFNEMASHNMVEANSFMAKNVDDEDIVIIEEGKLHYKITQEGHGKAVPENGTPLINYTGKYIDGTVFGSSLGNGAPITLPLDRTIPGFRMGLIGMKEGEKRTLFIHPDLGYGMSGNLVPPNSLLVFEIELLEADRSIASATDDLPSGDVAVDEEVTQ